MTKMKKIKQAFLCMLFFSVLTVKAEAVASIPGGDGTVHLSVRETFSTCTVSVDKISQQLRFDVIAEADFTTVLKYTHAYDKSVFTFSGCQDSAFGLTVKSDGPAFAAGPGGGLYYSGLGAQLYDSSFYYSVSVGTGKRDNTVSGKASGTVDYSYAVPLDGSREVRITPDSNSYSLTATTDGVIFGNQVPDGIYSTGYIYNFNYD
ncbi:TPA: hypothetical protein I8P56_004478 [Salmonella enterica subsp. enterica serovar Napoli]|nr:hypothetical protein [Salmonella enterica subsp. enterica serovar Napoli]